MISLRQKPWSILTSGYARVVLTVGEVGFSHVSCTGNERGLEDCTVGNLTSQTCSQAGIAQCFNGNDTYYL